MSWRKKFKSWVSMKRQRCLFVDCISGEPVYLYVDCYGKEWMANRRFGLRVARREGAQ